MERGRERGEWRVRVRVVVTEVLSGGEICEEMDFCKEGSGRGGEVGRVRVRDKGEGK